MEDEKDKETKDAEPKVVENKKPVDAKIVTLVKKKKMSDSDKIKQLSKAVHFLASMMGKETFDMAVENFPVLSDFE